MVYFHDPGEGERNAGIRPLLHGERLYDPDIGGLELASAVTRMGDDGNAAIASSPHQGAVAQGSKHIADGESLRAGGAGERRSEMEAVAYLLR